MTKKLEQAYKLIWEDITALPEPLRNDAVVILARLDALIKRIKRAEGRVISKTLETH